jgi:Concanavalin A-like lectin/glucanases superfamily
MRRMLLVLLGLCASIVLALPAVSLADSTPAGLVSWWQAEGNANDSVGSNNGTLVGGVTFAAGHPGQAFNFDGSTGYVSIGNPSNLQSHGGDFTISEWVRFASLVSPPGSPSALCWTSYGCDMAIANKEVSSGGDPNADGWRLLKASDNHLYFCVGGPGNGCVAGGSPTTAESTTVAVAGTWYHVAGVFSAVNGLSLCVNGVLEGSATGRGS